MNCYAIEWRLETARGRWLHAASTSLHSTRSGNVWRPGIQETWQVDEKTRSSEFVRINPSGTTEESEVAKTWKVIRTIVFKQAMSTWGWRTWQGLSCQDSENLITTHGAISSKGRESAKAKVSVLFVTVPGVSFRINRSTNKRATDRDQVSSPQMSTPMATVADVNRRWKFRGYSADPHDSTFNGCVDFRL